MKKIKSIIIMTGIGIYIFLLIGLTFIQNKLWWNIIAPFGSLFAGIVLFHSFLESKKPLILKSVWLIFSIASFIWMASDGFCSIYYLSGRNPQDAFPYSFYPIANFLLALGCIILEIYRFKRWNGLQLFFDCIAATFCTLYFIWLFLFDKKLVFLQVLEQNGIFSSFSAVMDIAIIIGIFIWILSVRRSAIQVYVQIVTLGIFIFALNNLIYCYLYLNGTYSSNSIIDTIYIVALLIVAIGSGADNQDNPYKDTEDYNEFATMGLCRRSLFLFIYPIVAVIFKGLIIRAMIIYAFIIAFYIICTVYIQIALKNEQLLNKEKELNHTLEEQVRQRTSELIEKNKALDAISNLDTVTNLYNRRYFTRALQEKMECSERSVNIALLFIDLDRFKTINDTYGHDIGDRVLIEISKRLQKWIKENIVLARLGGDEFVLALSGQFGYHQIELLAEKMIKSCTENIEIDEYLLHVTMSVGISIYPTDAQNSDSLMKNADIAMYQAKAKGFNQYVSFNSILNEKSRYKNKIEMLLKRADFDKEFELYYQPQFNIASEKIVGMEALLRWKTPNGESIPPAEFIPIAEETDYIIPIGEWVMIHAIRQIVEWNHTYHTQLKMGINVSPKQLDNKNFIFMLKNTMNNYEVSAKWLDVEITENIAMEGKQRLTEVATMFNEMGISISIDDFGTGYSSLSYLKYFPFDRIKISKPLIDAISDHSYDLQIVKAIILLAKSTGLKTIAEGVETKNQLDILKQLECEEVQGFLFSKPLPAHEFEERFFKRTSV